MHAAEMGILLTDPKLLSRVQEITWADGLLVVYRLQAVPVEIYCIYEYAEHEDYHELTVTYGSGGQPAGKIHAKMQPPTENRVETGTFMYYALYNRYVMQKEFKSISSINLN